jgi:hypothetical protein
MFRGCDRAAGGEKLNTMPRERSGRTRTSARTVPVALVFGLAAACGEPAPAELPARPPPVPVLAIAAPRPVSTSIAFDLVSTPGGAVLAWGTPARVGGGLRVLALDPLGAPRGTDVDVVRLGEARAGSAEEAPAQIEELAAASSGTRVGLAWVLGGPTPIVQGTFSSQEAEGFAAARTLAPTTALTPGSRPARGRIAMSSREDGALVLTHRLEDANCSEAIAAEAGTPGASCARIARQALDSLDAARAAVVDLEVPSPCPALLAGAVTTSGTWFYGTCHQAPSLATTVYAIRPSLSYAAANDSLSGCTPDAMAPLAEGVAIAGACEGARRMSFVDATGRESSVLTDPRLEATCESGRPVLSIGGDATPRRLGLAAAVSRLEGLLPERIAPRGARAVWTGSALLVATPLEGEVSLRRYECREASFVRTDLP